MPSISGETGLLGLGASGETSQPRRRRLHTANLNTTTALRTEKNFVIRLCKQVGSLPKGLLSPRGVKDTQTHSPPEQSLIPLN